MKEMGEEGRPGRFRELKYEDENLITLGFRQEKTNTATAG